VITPAYAPTATERVLPRMALDFTTGTLDPRVTVTRALNTATAVNSSGNIAIVNANLPRFDYDPVTLAPKGLLIEESRANSAVYSNDVTGAGWTLGGLTTSTPTTSPDGTANAVLLLEDSSTGFHRAFQVVTTTAVAWTVTGYFKPNGRDWVWLRMNDSVGIKYAWFNITTGAKGTVQSGLTADIYPSKNGFYRCVITAATAASGAAAVIFGTADADNSNSFAGDVTKGVYFYGFQIELGAFATSYIPTTTTSLTRNADSVNMTGTNFSSWYNASEGTLSFEGSVFVDQGSTTVDFIQISNGVSNAISIDLAMFGVAGPVFSVGNSGNQCNIDTGTLTLNTVFRMVGAYKADSFAAALNGGTPGTDNAGTIPTVSQMGIGNRLSGPYMNGHARKFAYWPQRLINAEVQAFSK